MTESRCHELDDLVFRGYCRELPINKHVLQNAFYKALRRIGIVEAVRRERRLVWHSTRHTFNSLMRGKIDGGKFQRIVGHSSERTNLSHTHAFPEDLAVVRNVRESIFAVTGKPERREQETTGAVSALLPLNKEDGTRGAKPGAG